MSKKEMDKLLKKIIDQKYYERCPDCNNILKSYYYEMVCMICGHRRFKTKKELLES